MKKLLPIALLMLAGSVAASTRQSLPAKQFAAKNITASELQITDVKSDFGTVAINLERVQTFSADAKIVNETAKGQRHLARPTSQFYRGQLQGALSGPVFIALHTDGTIQGIARTDMGTQLLQQSPNGLVLNEMPAQATGSNERFQCALHDHEQMQVAAASDANQSLIGDADELLQSLRTTNGVLYNVRLAIETDQEFLARFGGNTTNATNYIGTLVGYLSTLYSDQVDAQLQVSFSRVWSTTDPWAQTSPGCGLLEFGKFWNDNMSAQSRTIAHFLSGKSTTAGIAWIGVLCQGQFNSSPSQVGSSCPGLADNQNYGGGYGFTSGISGSFSSGASIVWDSFSVAHELGHNFNSPHTHCYGNIGGNASPIDQCYAAETGTGCYSGATSLPGVGGASGTIMSYCHLLSGGFGNINMRFGEGQAFGTAPERVNQRMRAHLAARASANPQCLALPATTEFRNGFE
jgi:hypothetical protein